MTAELRSLLGTDDVGQAALGLLTGSLAAGTYRNYDSGMRSFATFCEQEGLRPLQATTSTIVRYTAWLGLQGTVGAESLQQYYSSINKYFRDHQRQPVALGEMVADARRGLAIQQERLAAEDVRVALPAPVAADILNTAIGFRQTLAWEPANIAGIRAFRAALATITAYVFLCRAESGISCETGDLVVDRPSGSILLYVRKQKGDQRTRVSAKPLITLPIAAVPDFADLLDWYTVSRDAYCRRFYGASPPPKFWSISPLESSATWSVSATLTEWLREAYLAAGARPPTGFKWTSHSLRKGAASAASCVGVPLPAIKHMGDWSKNSEVVTGKYIDPTMRPTPAAWRFFGIAVRREVDDLFQQAVPLGNTVPRDELKDLVPDAELSLPAFNVVTGSYDPRSLKSTLLEFKTMRYGVKYTSVPRATAVDRFERSLLGDIQRGLAARDAAWHNTEPGQKGPLRDILDMSEYTGMVFGTVGEVSKVVHRTERGIACLHCEIQM
eukprot:jgi/Tetstr1/421113/TSEL_012157.t2